MKKHRCQCSGWGKGKGILEVLQYTINKPALRLMPEGRFPKVVEDFMDACLLMNPEVRKVLKELLVSSSSNCSEVFCFC